MYLSDAHWTEYLDALKAKVCARRFQTWFNDLKLESHDDDALYLAAPNRFIRIWLQQHYGEMLLDTLEEMGFVRPAALKVRVDARLFDKMRRRQRERQPAAVAAGSVAEAPGLFDRTTATLEMPKPSTARPARETAPRPQAHNKLAAGPSWATSVSRHLRLENFVVGLTNQFPYAVARQVAENPGAHYNPILFIGGTGTGKTHLLQGICNALKENHPTLRAAYVSSEEFVNGFLDALKNKSLEQFRNRYRHVDVLALDDLHFVGGKEHTQIEFCNTFDALLHLDKQIILSAEAHPREIPGLKAKLVTRLLSGLSVEMQSPCVETKRLILQKKAARMNVKLPDDVASQLARKLDGNVWELEGAVKKLVALSHAEQRPVDTTLMDRAVRVVQPPRVGPVTMAEICRAVENHYGISHEDIRSKSRQKRVLMPRQVAMYLARHLTDISFDSIGQYFGRNHTTAMHSVKIITSGIARDPSLAHSIQQLMHRLGR